MKRILKSVLLFLALAVAVAGEPVKVVVEILGKGEVSIDSTRCGLAAVETSLKEKKADAPELVVLIVASSDADLPTVSGVMDACRKAGISKFTLQAK
jgi:biopolymer transport protein ExbD